MGLAAMQGFFYFSPQFGYWLITNNNTRVRPRLKIYNGSKINLIHMRY